MEGDAMTIKTMKSEDARIRFRDVMDEVSAGSTEIVVERYHKLPWSSSITRNGRHGKRRRKQN